MYNQWVIDVSVEAPKGLASFCPVEDGRVVVGLNYVSDRAPGELVGVTHRAGLDEVKKWMRANKNWKEKYGKI